jgi:DNA polymerase III delta prime subunit
MRSEPFNPWDMLCARYQQKSLPHAVLLISPDSHFAYRFARYVLSEANAKTQILSFIDARTHPDFKYLEITETIGIDDIRALIQFANNTPQMGHYKVIIIAGAERMNTASSNALLKMLEEPPGQALILLTTHQPDRLLPTIRSRCQMIRLPDVLQEPLTPELLAQRQELILELKSILSGQGDIVKICERWVKLDQSVLLEDLTNGIIDMIHLESCVNKTNAKHLFTYLDRLYEARRCLFNKLNPNIQLILENLFINS